MHRQRVMPFLRLVDDVVVDERHGVEEFEDDPKIQNCFFVISAKSFVRNPQSKRSDSFSAGKDKGIDIFYEVIDFFVADELLRLFYLVVHIGLQNAVEGGLETG